MNAVLEFLLVLATVHVAWVYFYLCGTLVRTPRFGLAPSEGTTGSGSALVEVVVRTAVGCAITGFVSFFLGLAGLLSVLGFGLWLLVLAALFAYFGDPPWRAAFWSVRAAVWRRAASPGAIVIWLVALPLGFVSAIPDLGSDASTVYMVYATEWARAHSLVVDTFLRLPYYAYNWPLTETWLIVFGRSDAAGTLGWLTGTLSLLGVYGYVLTTGESEEAPPRPSTVVLGLLAVATIVLSPVFLRWLGSPTLDVAIGFFFLACMLTIATLVRTRGSVGLVDLIACGGFFVGMKISLILFLPVLAAAVVYGSLLAHRSRRFTLAAIAALVVIAAPWYARNFVLAGDPITPVLNLSLRGVDPKFSKADFSLVDSDLKSHEGGPLERAEIPLEIFREPAAWQFRSPGVTLVMLTLGLPGAVAGYLFLRKRKVSDASAYATGAFVLYAIGYWLITSYMARYSLEFDAALVAFVAGLLALVSRAARPLRWAAILCLALFAIPSPGAAAYYGSMWDLGRDFYANYTDRHGWLLPRGPAYAEVEYLSAAIHKTHREDLHVYRAFIESDRQYWTEHDVTAIGDAVGPDRYADFKAAIASNELAPYVAQHKIGAVIVQLTPSAAMPDDVLAQLDHELRALHFKRVVLTNSPWVTYVSLELQPGVADRTR